MDQPHDIETWKKIFRDQTTTHLEMANRVIGDLVGYQHSSRYRKADAAQLVNAMRAFTELTVAENL